MAAALFSPSACASRAKTDDPLAGYREALAATDPAKMPTVKPDSPEERAAIERFKDFFAVYSTENIQAKLAKTYADNVWFNDTLKEVRGLAALEKYMLEGAANTESCTVEYDDALSKGGDHYLRWRMTIRFKKLKKGRTFTSIGMTHLRFNEQGRIVFHQDYWDAATGFFDKLPVLGGLIRFVKRRL